MHVSIRRSTFGIKFAIRASFGFVTALTAPAIKVGIEQAANEYQ